MERKRSPTSPKEAPILKIKDTCCCRFGVVVGVLVIGLMGLFTIHLLNEHHRMSHIISRAEGAWITCQTIAWSSLHETMSRDHIQAEVQRCNQAEHDFTHSRLMVDSIIGALALTAQSLSLNTRSYDWLTLCDTECHSTIRRAFDAMIPWMPFIVLGMLYIIYICVIRVVSPYLRYRYVVKPKEEEKARSDKIAAKKRNQSIRTKYARTATPEDNAEGIIAVVKKEKIKDDVIDITGNSNNEDAAAEDEEIRDIESNTDPFHQS